MCSWGEKEGKLEVTGAPAAKAEEMRGPGCCERHVKGYTASVPHPRWLWPLQPLRQLPPSHPARASPTN